jgi:type IV pilus biogenesis protein PilP
MADNLTPFDPAAAPASPQPGIRGFLNSRSGRLIVGIAAVVVVVAVLGAIGMTFFGASGGQDVASTPNSGAGGAAATKPPTEVAAIKVPADVELDDVFTYRDVFVPTVVLVSSTTTSTTSTSNSSTTGTTNTSNSSTTSTPEDTLVLEDIATENGAPVAVLSWNGETYTLAEGETIPNTPWKVLEINSSTVVMLYGDARITLSVGVGISK